MQSATYVKGKLDYGIEMLPLFTENECSKIRSTLYDLKSYWHQRTPILPFYTLGAASYLDARGDEYEYIRKATHYNTILWEHFSWMYKRLRHTLETKLGKPIVYKSNAALPGFYIFLAHRAYIKMLPSVHADWQYLNLDWAWARNVSRPISYTLAVSLPHCGSGINIWNLSATQLSGLSREEGDELLRRTDKSFFAYRVGWLTVHFGHLIHQIAPPTHVVATDERITVQGHGLLCDGTFHLYW